MARGQRGREGSGRAALAYVQNRLVRHSAEAGAAPALAEAGEGAGLVLMAGERVLLRMAAGSATVLLTPSEGARAGALSHEVFLGRVEERPVFAAAAVAEAAELFAEPDFRAVDLRALASEGSVAPAELGLAATAKSLLAWHARHGFCGRCGSPTTVAASGFRRECGTCGLHHFPRTDPVAIMLVRRGQSCLLGRGPHFKPGMYSCLAGFIEPGETVEDAARRETFEETGVRVGAVSYHASQPWPFPSSLMLGCVADALTEDIAIDPAELEDARWFSRDDAARMLEGTHPEGFSVPPATAIAHLLVRDWVEGRLRGPARSPSPTRPEKCGE